MPEELTFTELLQALSKENLKFLMIGGHAVNLYGYSRDTHDVDLLVRRTEAPLWKEVLLRLGYTIFREESTFLQLSPTRSLSMWPLDLMLVNDSTFEKLLAGSKSLSYRGIEIPVPAVEHLVALKLHVLKQEMPHRTIKDFMDVQGLIEYNGLNLRSEAMREIFEKYGTPDLYRRMKNACDQNDEKN